MVPLILFIPLITRPGLIIKSRDFMAHKPVTSSSRMKVPIVTQDASRTEIITTSFETWPPGYFAIYQISDSSS